MDEKKKKMCPILDKDCLEKDCEWFCIFDQGGAREVPQGCAVRFLTQTVKMVAMRPK